MCIRDSVSDDAYLDAFTVVVSLASGMNATMCGNESWSETTLSVSHDQYIKRVYIYYVLCMWLKLIFVLGDA